MTRVLPLRGASPLPARSAAIALPVASFVSPSVALSVALPVAVLCGVAGCVDRGDGPAPEANPGLVSAALREDVPAELTPRLDARLGEAVVYLGNLVDREVLVPGESVTIRHFWRVVSPPGATWRVSSQLRGAADDASFQNLDDTPLRRALPLARWRAGQIIEDVQKTVLRADWSSPQAILLVALAPRGGHRAADRVPVSGGPRQDDAVVARRFSVELAKAPPPPGTVVVPKARVAPVIDGSGDDPAWQAAPWSPEFVAAEGLRDPAGRAQAKLTWDDTHLYLLVHVDDPDVASPYQADDDPLWKADCVELFIDADSNRRQYVELQVNPHNAHFDSYFASTRAQPGDVSFDAHLVSQVRVLGTIDLGTDTDVGWDAEVAIPWPAVKGNAADMQVRLPPAPGDRLRLNVVRVDRRPGEQLTASSWNRITAADFHALDRMLTVVLAAPAAGGATL